MSTDTLYRVKQLRKKSDEQLDRKALNRSTLKPIKSYNLTRIHHVSAKLGDSVEIQARDYVQALEHALYVAGFFIEKQESKNKNLTKR
jgi:hypothetical protein